MTIKTNLCRIFCNKRDDDEGNKRNNGQQRRPEELNVEDDRHGSADHQKDGRRSEDGGRQHGALVEHVKIRDVVVCLYRSSGRPEQVQEVGERRRSPTATLFEELVEGFGGVGLGVGGGRVLDSIAALE